MNTQQKKLEAEKYRRYAEEASLRSFMGEANTGPLAAADFSFTLPADLETAGFPKPLGSSASFQPGVDSVGNQHQWPVDSHTVSFSMQKSEYDTALKADRATLAKMVQEELHAKALGSFIAKQTEVFIYYSYDYNSSMGYNIYSSRTFYNINLDTFENASTMPANISSYKFRLIDADLFASKVGTTSKKYGLETVNGTMYLLGSLQNAYFELDTDGANPPTAFTGPLGIFGDLTTVDGKMLDDSGPEIHQLAIYGASFTVSETANEVSFTLNFTVETADYSLQGHNYSKGVK